MANKRGRPKKLAVLQEKDFSRQFQEACIPALLVDRELAVIYANPYALDTMPELEQPEGLERLLADTRRLKIKELWEAEDGDGAAWIHALARKIA